VFARAQTRYSPLRLLAPAAGGVVTRRGAIGAAGMLLTSISRRSDSPDRAAALTPPSPRVRSGGQ
jgi:hypothetical protein